MIKARARASSLCKSVWNPVSGALSILRVDGQTASTRPGPTVGPGATAGEVRKATFYFSEQHEAVRQCQVVCSVLPTDEVSLRKCSEQSLVTGRKELIKSWRD